MKNLFYTLLFLVGFSAKSQVADTSQYLIDSIIQRKSLYIGKPLKDLISALKIQISNGSDINATFGQTDSFYTKEITLRFFEKRDYLDRVFNDKNTPALLIIFQDTVAVLRSYLKTGGILDDTTEWNKYKTGFWGQFVVADIRLSGVY